MSETVKEKIEVAEDVTIEAPKPYEFRQLSSTDIFLMSRIISKIGINEFAKAAGSENVVQLIKSLTDEEKESDNGGILVAATAVAEIANVLLANIGNCEKEIYQLLAQTSNLTVAEITAPGNAVMFVDMIFDFVRKEEFPGFFEAVSRLFKKK